MEGLRFRALTASQRPQVGAENVAVKQLGHFVWLGDARLKIEGGDEVDALYVDTRQKVSDRLILGPPLGQGGFDGAPRVIDPV